MVSDYVSPADRTIAINLKGDCDDFSVLMASSIEAIGGRVRLVAGNCERGGHAWCELYVGTEKQKEDVRRFLTNYYGGKAEYMKFTKDNNQKYWLVVDWQMGELTCGDSIEEILYIKGGKPRY